LPGVVNAHVAAREWQDDIVFLHKIVPGRSDRSYGIQVARLAGMPAAVIVRARAILEALEHDELTRGGRPSISGTPADPQQQLGLFQIAPAGDPVGEMIVQRLRDLEPNSLTPLQALTLLAELKKELE
jgi:DNA mismatch repair protein MutS